MAYLKIEMLYRIFTTIKQLKYGIKKVEIHTIRNLGQISYFKFSFNAYFISYY